MDKNQGTGNFRPFYPEEEGILPGFYQELRQQFSLYAHESALPVRKVFNLDFWPYFKELTLYCLVSKPNFANFHNIKQKFSLKDGFRSQRDYPEEVFYKVKFSTKTEKVADEKNLSGYISSQLKKSVAYLNQLQKIVHDGLFTDDHMLVEEMANLSEVNASDSRAQDSQALSVDSFIFDNLTIHQVELNLNSDEVRFMCSFESNELMFDLLASIDLKDGINTKKIFQSIKNEAFNEWKKRRGPLLDYIRQKAKIKNDSENIFERKNGHYVPQIVQESLIILNDLMKPESLHSGDRASIESCLSKENKKAAWRKYHPDKKGNEVQFKELQRCIEIVEDWLLKTA